MKQRIIVWFSCGEASAAASKEAIEFYRGNPLFEVVIVNCDTRQSEHPDNYRFCRDCEKWFGQPIVFIRRGKYVTIDDVFTKTKYMAGIQGARCTTELKKLPRLAFSTPEDIHVFGLTADEGNRIKKFRERNPELKLWFVLWEKGITKAECRQIIIAAGIQTPAMYVLGFDNNNCPGCVKATSPWYWDMVRKHFPAIFTRRAEQSRSLGVRLVRVDNQRIFLDELPPGPFKKWTGKKREDLSCGPECASPGVNP